MKSLRIVFPLSRRISMVGKLSPVLFGLAVLAAGELKAQSGTWTSTANGLWSGSSNWAGGIIADGSGNTADFNTVDLPGDRTVSLDSLRTIGALVFGDTVTSTAGSWTVNNNGNSSNILTLASSTTPTITLNSLGAGKTVTLALELAGSQGLAKSGTGSLILTGTNTYTGTTTVNVNGSLQIGNGGTTGSISSSSPIVTNGTLTNQGIVFNRSDSIIINNVISGAGRVNQAGSGTLALTNGANSYSGVTGLTAGTLRGSDSTIQTAATSTTSVLGAGSVIGFSNGTVLQLRANGTNDANAQTILFRNGLQLAAAGSFTVNVDRESATGGTGKNLGVTAGTTIANSGTMNVTGANGFGLTLAALTAGSGGVSGTATINPTTANVTVASIQNAGTTLPHTIVLGGTSTGNRVTGGLLNNTATGVLSVTKSNSSTWTVSGSGNYTGATTVTAGSLIIGTGGNINSTSGVTVAAGSNAKFIYNNNTVALIPTVTLSGSGTSSRAVLGGDGKIGSSLVLNDLGDTLSPGNSPGTLSFTTGQTWDSFSYDWELNNFPGTTAGTDFDQIAITGSLDLAGGTNSYLLNVISLTLGNVPGNVGNFTDATTSWTILTATGGITGFSVSDWQINTGAFLPTAGGTWSISLNDTVGTDSLILTYTAVPEPGTCALFLLGAALMMAKRRRKA